MIFIPPITAATTVTNEKQIHHQTQQPNTVKLIPTNLPYKVGADIGLPCPTTATMVSNGNEAYQQSLSPNFILTRQGRNQYHQVPRLTPIAAASTISNENQMRRQSQPSTVSTVPTTQSRSRCQYYQVLCLGI